MVNLSKERLDKPLREYSPAHICDEYANIPKHNPISANQEYTPIHIHDEILTANTPSAAEVEVIPQKQTLAAPSNKAISYTQASADRRQKYLASIFQTASEAVMSQYGLPIIFRKIVKRCTFVKRLLTILMSFMCLFFIGGIIGFTFGNNNLGLILIQTSLVSVVLTIVSLFANPQLSDMPAYAYSTMRKATDVYISNYGASQTEEKIMKSPQNVDCYIYKPKICKNEEAFRAVTKNKHDVFVIYSSKTQCAIVIDPKLFE